MTRDREPGPAHAAATSSSSVDLPTPGSPATRMTAPGTRPPPSTRSSSPTPLGLARAASTSTSAIGRAGALTGPAETVRSLAAPTSSMVPHAWHSGQRPTHLGTPRPHSLHENAGRSRVAVLEEVAMLRRLSAPGDSSAQDDGAALSRSYG